MNNWNGKEFKNTTKLLSSFFTFNYYGMIGMIDEGCGNGGGKKNLDDR